DDLPRFIAPVVGRRVEPVRPRTGEYEVPPALGDRRLALPVPGDFADRRVEGRIGGAGGDFRGAARPAPSAEHVAVRAARRDFVAAAPGVPSGVGPLDDGALTHGTPPTPGSARTRRPRPLRRRRTHR